MADENIGDRIINSVDDSINAAMDNLINGLTPKDKKDNQKATQALYDSLNKSVREIVDRLTAQDKERHGDVKPKSSGKASSVSGKKTDIQNLPDEQAIPAVYIGETINNLFKSDSAFYSSIGKVIKAQSMSDKNIIKSLNKVDATLEKGFKGMKGGVSYTVKQATTKLKSEVAIAKDHAKVQQIETRAQNKGKISKSLTDMLASAGALSAAGLNFLKIKLNVIALQTFLDGMDKAEKTAAQGNGYKELGKAGPELKKSLDSIYPAIKTVSETKVNMLAANMHMRQIKRFIQKSGDFTLSPRQKANLEGMGMWATSIETSVMSVNKAARTAGSAYIPIRVALIKKGPMDQIKKFIVTASKLNKDEHDIDIIKPGTISSIKYLEKFSESFEKSSKAMKSAAGSATLAIVPMLIFNTIGHKAMATFIDRSKDVGKKANEEMKGVEKLEAWAKHAEKGYRGIRHAAEAAILAGPLALIGSAGALLTIPFILATNLAGKVAFKATLSIGGLIVFGLAAVIGYAALAIGAIAALASNVIINKLFENKNGNVLNFTNEGSNPALKVVEGLGNFVINGLIFAFNMVSFMAATALVGAMGQFAAPFTLGLILFGAGAALGFICLVPAAAAAAQAMQEVNKIFQNPIADLDAQMPGEGFWNGLGKIGLSVIGDIAGVISGLMKFAGLALLMIMGSVLGLIGLVCTPGILALAEVGPALEKGFGGMSAGISSLGTAMAAANKVGADINKANDDTDYSWFEQGGLLGGAESLIFGSMMGAFKPLMAMVEQAAALGKDIDDKKLANIKRLADVGEAMGSGVGPLAESMKSLGDLTGTNVGNNATGLSTINDAIQGIAKVNANTAKSNLEKVAKGIQAIGDATKGIDGQKLQALTGLGGSGQPQPSAGGASSVKNMDVSEMAGGGSGGGAADTSVADIKSTTDGISNKLDMLKSAIEALGSTMTEIATYLKPEEASWIDQIKKDKEGGE